MSRAQGEKSMKTSRRSSGDGQIKSLLNQEGRQVQNIKNLLSRTVSFMLHAFISYSTYVCICMYFVVEDLLMVVNFVCFRSDLGHIKIIRPSRESPARAKTVGGVECTVQ